MDYTDLIKQLKRHEGFRSKVYKCPAKKWTIGFGRNVEDNGITEEEAEYLLINDIERIEKELKNTYKWFDELDNTRKCVIINICYNIGVKKFGTFKKTIKHLEDKNYNEAGVEMLYSRWAKQVFTRATELAEQMLSGKFI